MSDTITYSSELGTLLEGEHISYSFHTPGWYLVLGSLVLTALVFILLRLRLYFRNKYRREALQRVDGILAGEPGHWSFAINQLLKNVALEKFERTSVAALYGQEWYAFLRSTSMPDERFSEKDFERFTEYTYNGQVPGEDLGEKLGDFARHWINTHHAGSI